MNIINKNGNVTVETGDRLDAATAPELSVALTEISFQSLTIDMEQTIYISSAGLRALIIGKKQAAKQGASMALTHVNPTVMEVLNMSGFTKIIDIR